VRETARIHPELKFTSLLHHIDAPMLHTAFDELKKDAAAGIDEMTWREYEPEREERIVDLHGRIHRGAYRAKPSKRLYIAKADGRKRPIGIATVTGKSTPEQSAFGLR
jgi:retron-type reverse transcriptase